MSGPGDALERQADRIAEAAVFPARFAGPADKAARAQRLATSEPPGTVRGNAPAGTRAVTAPASGRGIRAGPPPAAKRAAGLPDSGGQPLAESLRELFEPRFGQEFGAVRVHADKDAARLAAGFNARAFTFGNDIYFGDGQYRPATPSGQRLIAHELAHVWQQQRGAPTYVQRWPSWDEIRESMFSGLIAGLRSAQRAGVSRLRAWAATLDESQRTIANGIITGVEAVSEILIQLIFAVVGLVVGFGEAIVQMIVGLVQLAVGIIQGLLLFLYGFIDGGRRFDEWAQGVLDAIASLPAALRQLVDAWLRRFETASSDRQVIMIGELTGQILALIATFEVAAARAGSLPRVTVAISETAGPRLAMATAGTGGRVMAGAGTAITVDVASPAAAAGMTGALAMSVDASLESLLGEGPETEAVRETTRRRAGMAERPQHHIFPREHRRFFEQRGFDDIDDFCVELEEAHHQALHGGGDWRLGRTWPGEWNRRIMAELTEAERFMGRPLVRDEIVTIGRELMVEYGIEPHWVRWRGAP